MTWVGESERTKKERERRRRGELGVFMFPDEAKGKAKAVETGIPGRNNVCFISMPGRQASADKGGTKIKIYAVSPPYF